jgi:hypothetical protein
MEPRRPSAAPPLPLPPVTPVWLVGAAAARGALRGVSAAPLAAAVRATSEAASEARARAAVAAACNLSGRWRKDWAASDSMVRACTRAHHSCYGDSMRALCARAARCALCALRRGAVFRSAGTN